MGNLWLNFEEIIHWHSFYVVIDTSNHNYS